METHIVSEMINSSFDIYVHFFGKFLPPHQLSNPEIRINLFKCVWATEKLCEYVQPTEEDFFRPSFFIPVVFKKSGLANNAIIRKKMIRTTATTNMVETLECMQNITEEEYKLALANTIQKAMIYEICPFKNINTFLLSGEDVYTRRQFFTLDFADDIIVHDQESTSLYLSCPLKSNEQIRRLFLDCCDPSEILPLIANPTFDEIVLCIERARPVDTIILYSYFGDYLMNPELRRALIDKTAPDLLPTLLSALWEPTLEETYYVMDKFVTSPYHLYVVTAFKTNPNIRKTLLEKSTPGEIHSIITAFSNPTIEEYEIVFSKTDNPELVYTFCPFKDEFRSRVTNAVETTYSRLVICTDEQIIATMKQMPPAKILPIFNIIPRKDSNAVRSLALELAAPKDVFFLYYLFPNPTIEETLTALQKSSEENIFFIFRHCYFKFSDEVRRLALERVSLDMLTPTWCLLFSHTIGETLYVMKKSREPAAILSYSHLYQNSNFMTFVLQQLDLNEDELVKIFCMIENPSAAQSLLFLERYPLKIYGYTICGNHDDHRIRKFFIENTIDEFPQESFALLENKSPEEEKMYIDRIHEDYMETIYWLCNFRDTVTVRHAFLNRVADTGLVSVLALMDNLTDDELCIAIGRDHRLCKKKRRLH